MNQLLVQRLHPESGVPQRGTPQSAGLDLSAYLLEPVVLAPGETEKIPTGIGIALPINTVGLVYGRSSLGANHGITLANAVGVIDEDYRGEIVVALINHSKKSYTIRQGDRIAQLVVTPIILPEIRLVEELPDSQRGAGGFGSTGR